ncbi:uncharacterized protein LOC110117752 [Ceratitis capitata]|uniref:uncharacterized protein LOC110117752 n=1 Tax=Ceratitis capitata TaxID=7213 RepID=UPI000A10C771|nr:uncharacterized protein LOC110117752 [Ceratitis capitata]
MHLKPTVQKLHTTSFSIYFLLTFCIICFCGSGLKTKETFFTKNSSRFPKPRCLFRVMFDNFLSMLRKRRRLENVPDDSNAQTTAAGPAERAAGAEAYWDTLFNTGSTADATGISSSSFSTSANTAARHAATTTAAGDNDISLLSLPSMALCSTDRCDFEKKKFTTRK